MNLRIYRTKEFHRWVLFWIFGVKEVYVINKRRMLCQSWLRVIDDSLMLHGSRRKPCQHLHERNKKLNFICETGKMQFSNSFLWSINQCRNHNKYERILPAILSEVDLDRSCATWIQTGLVLKYQRPYSSSLSTQKLCRWSPLFF